MTTTVIVDSAPVGWYTGVAGDDEPRSGLNALGPAHTAPELGLDPATAPLYHSPADFDKLRRRHEQENWEVFEAFVRKYDREHPPRPAVLPPAGEGYLHDGDDHDDDEALRGVAVFTINVFDDVASDIVARIARRVLEREPGSFPIRFVAFQLQEVLAVYGMGRTTALVVNFVGTHVTVLGVYEGVAVGETARRFLRVGSERLFRDDPTEWERVTRLGEQVADAILSAPLDTRRDLYGNILFVGGARPYNGWDRMDEHLLDVVRRGLDARQRGWGARARVRVVKAQESGLSSWIGGSIFGSLSSTGLNTPGPARELPNTLNLEAWREVSGGVPPPRARWYTGWDSSFIKAAAAAAAVPWRDDHRAECLALVRAAPSLVEALPDDLIELVADKLAEANLADIGRLRAATHLHPSERFSHLSDEDRLAADLACTTLGGAGTTIDDVLLRARFDPCVAELHTRFAAPAAGEPPRRYMYRPASE